MSPFPYRVLRGARLSQLLADSVPFSDADAEESPEPASRPAALHLTSCAVELVEALWPVLSEALRSATLPVV